MFREDVKIRQPYDEKTAELEKIEEEAINSSERPPIAGIDEKRDEEINVIIPPVVPPRHITTVCTATTMAMPSLCSASSTFAAIPTSPLPVPAVRSTFASKKELENEDKRKSDELQQNGDNATSNRKTPPPLPPKPTVRQYDKRKILKLKASNVLKKLDQMCFSAFDQQ